LIHPTIYKMYFKKYCGPLHPLHSITFPHIHHIPPHFLLLLRPMKHLPNLLTLGNLFCGCVAIAYILNAQPYYYVRVDNGIPTFTWVYGVEQLCYGSLFIFIAAVCDLLDGFTARALKVFSPIGKDLDSLADVVSFGVAPSMILYKLLFDAAIQENNAFEVSIIQMVPAFLVACFAALRLAKFNITASSQKSYFIGMPVPATGIIVASLPLILWSHHSDIAMRFTNWLQYKWVLYSIIALLCFLMVSKVKFFKMIPPKMKIAYLWPQLVVLVAGGIAIPFLEFAAIPVGFILYILLSLVYKQPVSSQNDIEDADFEEVNNSQTAITASKNKK
jgi:CDP-diacylglycerol---serine O-phosphatidyltransferase